LKSPRLERPRTRDLDPVFAEKSGLLTFIVALLLAALVAVSLFWRERSARFVAPLAVSLGLVKLANKAFGGINGDVIGSSNELGRLVALIAISLL